MASSPSGNALTDAHRRQQAALSVQVLGHMRTLWPMLDPQRLDATRGPWTAAVVDLATQAYSASAGLAAAYVPAYRALEEVPGRAVLPPLRPLEPALIAGTAALLGIIQTKQRLAAGLDVAEAMRIGERQAAKAVQTLAGNGGANLITDTVLVDKAALGWCRVASAGACAFCAMLCGRGPVYRSEHTALRRPHGGCNCTAELIYRTGHAAWPPAAQAYGDSWVDASLDADLDAGGPRREDRRARGGDAARRAAYKAYRAGEGPRPPALEKLGRQPTQRERDALNAYRRHLYSQRTEGAANARRADRLDAEATRRRAEAEAAPDSAARAKAANLAEDIAARARANTPAARELVAAADQATAEARAAAAPALERQAAATTEAAIVRTEEQARATEAARALADPDAVDDAGVPYRLTIDYLERREADDPDLDDLIDHVTGRLDDDNPVEGARWDDLEAYLDYRQAEDAITGEAGSVPDDVITARLAELARTRGRVGLTHRASELEAYENTPAPARPTRKAVQADYAVYLEELYVRAEDATRGTLLNAKGRGAGISARSLFSGDVRRVFRYASEELLEFFETNRRVQWSEFYADATGSEAFAEAAARQRAISERIDRDRNAIDLVTNRVA